MSGHRDREEGYQAIEAGLSTRRGFREDTRTRDERRQDERHMHYVGFNNATLLSRRDNAGEVLYTSGILGCNALVLSSSEGAYVAHINVMLLDRANTETMTTLTERVIIEYERRLGTEPDVGCIVTSTGRPHPGIVTALERRRIERDIVHEDQYGIRIGGVHGSYSLVSNFNDQHLDHVRNMMPTHLRDWEVMARDLDRDQGVGRVATPRLPADPRLSEEDARRRADAFVAALDPRARAHAAQHHTEHDDPHYMQSTEASRAREEATKNRTAQVRAEALAIGDRMRRPLPAQPTIPIEDQHYIHDTISSQAKRREKVEKSSSLPAWK